jgi:hypothetical protein
MVPWRTQFSAAPTKKVWFTAEAEATVERLQVK